MLDVGEAAPDLARDVLARRRSAHDPVVGGPLDRRRSGDGQVEQLAAQQLSIGDGAAGRRPDHAPGHRQLPDRRAKAGRGHLQQGLARFRGGGADLRRSAEDRGAGVGAALVGGDVGVHLHRRNLVEVQVELLGGDLRQGGRGPLSELDEADEEGGGVVRVDRQPGVDAFRIGRSRRRTPGGHCAGRLRQHGRPQAEADDEGAAALQQLAPSNGEHAGHALTPLMAAAARWIALMIRG